MTIQRLLKDNVVLWLGVVLLLTLFVSRLVGLVAFPPFLDEAVHIRYAQAGFQYSPLIYASEGRLFALWWYMLFQPHLAASLWLIRVVTLIAVLPGVAASMAIGRITAGKWGFALAGLFYLFSTYHTFFDRLGLADPIAASVISIALFLGYRVSRTTRTRDAILLGMTLFIGINIKLSTLPYAAIPLIAGLTLASKNKSWRVNLRWAGIALLTEGILMGCFTLALRMRNYNLFTLYGTHNPSEIGINLSSVLSHVPGTIDLFTSYYTPIVLVLMLISVVILMIQRRFYLVLSLGLPLVVLWFNQSQYSRFFILIGTILLMCGAITLANLIRHRSRGVQILAISAVFVYGLVQWVPFVWTNIHNPAALSVALTDRQEYISSDASGFGLAEVQTALRSYSAKEVIGILSNCANLQFMINIEMKVTCPPLNPNGANVGPLNQLIADNRRQGVYVVLEDIPYVPQTVTGDVLTIIQRPDNGPHLTIIKLAP